jgi:hypothetical protein
MTALSALQLLNKNARTTMKSCDRRVITGIVCDCNPQSLDWILSHPKLIQSERLAGWAAVP